MVLNALNKFIMYGLIAIIGVLISVLTIQHFKIAKFKVDIIQKDNAISAYEELLKVVPFNRMVEERIGNAKEEINATLSDDNIIPDATYRL